MISLTQDILTLTSEAAILIRNGRLSFANRAAADVLGGAWQGRPAADYFSEEILNSQAPCFVAVAPVCGKHRIVRVTRMGADTAIFLSRIGPETALINDAYLSEMRNCLQTLALTLDRLHPLTDERADGELRRCFSAISRSYFKLNRLLGNLTTARGVLERTLPMTLSAVDLSGMCASTADSLAVLRPDVELHFAFTQGVCLWGDAALIESMLLNLLSNSLSHAVGLTRIDLRIDVTKDRVILALSDNGAGIPADRMCSVFNRFHSGFDLQDMAHGAGYGLTVVRGVAEMHGGTLLLESREGIGTTVRVSLSRLLGSEGQLREACPPYVGQMRSFLTGLADCLPDNCFTEKYLD